MPNPELNKAESSGWKAPSSKQPGQPERPKAAPDKKAAAKIEQSIASLKETLERLPKSGLDEEAKQETKEIIEREISQLEDKLASEDGGEQTIEVTDDMIEAAESGPPPLPKLAKKGAPSGERAVGGASIEDAVRQATGEAPEKESAFEELLKKDLEQTVTDDMIEEIKPPTPPAEAFEAEPDPTKMSEKEYVEKTGQWPPKIRKELERSVRELTAELAVAGKKMGDLEKALLKSGFDPDKYAVSRWEQQKVSLGSFFGSKRSKEIKNYEAAKKEANAIGIELARDQYSLKNPGESISKAEAETMARRLLGAGRGKDKPMSVRIR